MATQEVAHSVHGPCRSALVRGLSGHLFWRLPTPWDEVWWFDRQWNIVPDPTIEHAHIDLIGLAHAEADREKGPAKCYFIGGSGGPIKIGYSVDVGRRLKALQQASPVTLTVLATASGGIYRETAYHMQFDEYRLHGEWFERCPEIEAEIERLRT